MALNKSKDWRALLAHVNAYTVTLACGLWVWCFATHSDITISAVAVFCAFTYALHFVTDAVTSQWTSRLWFIQTESAGLSMYNLGQGMTELRSSYFVTLRDTRHWFFVVIGLDQLLHTWQLA